MSRELNMSGWPEGSAGAAFVVRDGLVDLVASTGDREAVFPWASVTKLAVALGLAVDVSWGFAGYDRPVGPLGSTLAHLLAHASGLGLDATAPVQPVGRRRVYSNVAYERAVESVIKDRPADDWLADRVFSPLGMNATRLTGSPASGAHGSLEDLIILATAYLRSDLIPKPQRDTITTAFLPALGGVVPGFGPFDRSPWGLGPQIKGPNDHWMGSDWSPDSYGHFGQSGAMVLLEPGTGIGVCAVSPASFGPWAVDRWPSWTNEARAVVASA